MRHVGEYSLAKTREYPRLLKAGSLYNAIQGIWLASWPWYMSHYYSFKIFPRFWLVKTTRIIHHKQLLSTKNFVLLNKWRQKRSPLQVIEPLTSKWRQQCSPLQVIEPLTLKIIEPLSEKIWAQGCVIQQREKWLRVEFTSLSEENILNE